MAKPIHLVIPEPDLDPGDKPVKTLFISPEGADPDREVPGFFIIQFNGEPIWPDGSTPDKRLPRQFLSLAAVHAYLCEQFGWKAPLRVTTHIQIERGGPRDFPAIWGADRRIGKKHVQVRVRYLGSFKYWDGRRVDPTKVGTAQEINLN
jgi:hypothetical protein